jgi:hypothetical protein
MATLKLDEPLRTREPVVDVPGDLPGGDYVVRLVVETANGRSEPAELIVHVVRPLFPRPIEPIPVTPIFEPLNPLRPK